MKIHAGQTGSILVLLAAMAGPAWAADNGISVTNYTNFCVNIRAYSAGLSHGPSVNIPPAWYAPQERASTMHAADCVRRYVVRMYHSDDCSQVNGHTTPQAKPVKNTIHGVAGCQMLYYDVTNPVLNEQGQPASFTLTRRK